MKYQHKYENAFYGLSYLCEFDSQSLDIPEFMKSFIWQHESVFQWWQADTIEFPANLLYVSENRRLFLS